MSDGEMSRRALILEAFQTVENEVTRVFSEGEIDADSLKESADNIRALIAKCLALLEHGDENVAWWIQIELYAGLVEPLGKALRQLPLTDKQGKFLFTPPRSQMLFGWVERTSLGPRYVAFNDDAIDNTDTFRNELVRPFTEAPSDMQWAPILDWRNSLHSDETAK